jgi:hypothetical protein
MKLYKNLYRGKPKGVTVGLKAPYTCYRGTGLGLDETEDMSFDLIGRIVLWDLQSTYSKYGDMVIYQKEGLPIGGMCSSIYADIQCAFDENAFLQREEIKDGNILGIRQIDDLLIFAPKEEIKNQIVASYDKGLTLESEEVKASTDRQGVKSYKMQYIGLDLTLKEGKIKAKVSNRNLAHIASHNRQLKPRFAPLSEYRSGAIYKQIVVGSLYRVRDYSIGAKQIQEAIEGLAYEFVSIGYSNRFFTQVLKRFITVKIKKDRQGAWQNALNRCKEKN